MNRTTPLNWDLKTLINKCGLAVVTDSYDGSFEVVALGRQEVIVVSLLGEHNLSTHPTTSWPEELRKYVRNSVIRTEDFKVLLEEILQIAEEEGVKKLWAGNALWYSIYSVDNKRIYPHLPIYSFRECLQILGTEKFNDDELYNLMYWGVPYEVLRADNGFVFSHLESLYSPEAV